MSNDGSRRSPASPTQRRALKKRDLGLESDVGPSGDTLPEVLPETNVGSFVMTFAARNGVMATRTRLDLFAEAVTRLTGDAVKLDEVGQALVALREKNLVTGAQMNTLMFNYLRERKKHRLH